MRNLSSQKGVESVAQYSRSNWKYSKSIQNYFGVITQAGIAKVHVLTFL